MSISFNTIPADIKVPLFYAEVDNSAANTASQTMKRLIIAQVNDNATAQEIGTLSLCSNDSLAKTIGGTGSMLAHMYTQWRKADPMGEVWILPLKNTTGSASSGSITFGGTVASSGLINLYIAGIRVRINATAGSNGATIAGQVTAAINASVDLPVVATVNEATVTINCKWTGETGNDITLQINQLGRNSGEFTPDGLTVKITALAGGTGAPELTEALSALGSEPFEFICNPFTDTASLNALQELMNDSSGRWSYMQQLYGHVYSAKRGSIGELVALGNSRNDQHNTIVGFEAQIPSSSWVIVAAFTAKTAVFISNDPARPTQTGELIGLQPAPASNRFTMQERQMLLSNGIATITYSGGALRIERGITTYQKNTYGQADNSYLDSETMHTTSYVLNQLKTVITSKYGRHKLANDGTRFGAGQAIVTPSVIRGELVASYSQMEENGIVENTDLFEEYLVVERDSDNPNRLNVLYPPDYVNQLRVFAVLNQFQLNYSTSV